MLATGWRSRERLSAARRGEADMASAVQKIKLCPSRDIPFNKLVLSQSNIRRVKAGVAPSGAGCQPSPDAAFVTLIDGKTILDLAEGLQVGRVRVMGVNRIELTGFTNTMRDRLRVYGLFGEIISRKLRFFVPVDGNGPAILAKVLERYPIARVADRAAA